MRKCDASRCPLFGNFTFPLLVVKIPTGPPFPAAQDSRRILRNLHYSLRFPPEFRWTPKFQPNQDFLLWPCFITKKRQITASKPRCRRLDASQEGVERKITFRIWCAAASTNTLLVGRPKREGVTTVFGAEVLKLQRCSCTLLGRIQRTSRPRLGVGCVRWKFRDHGRIYCCL